MSQDYDNNFSEFDFDQDYNLNQNHRYSLEKQKLSIKNKNIFEIDDYSLRQDKSFSKGDRVFHSKFGMGKILLIDGNKAHVKFDKAGTKNVITSFLMIK